MLRKIVSKTLAYGSTLVVLAMFGTVGFLGHKTHWTVPKPSRLVDDVPLNTATVTQPPNKSNLPKDELPLSTIRFESVSEVQDVGLNVAEARLATVDEFLFATAEVGYNQHRLAQLSSRVPGHIHSTRTRIGQTVKKGQVLALIDADQVGRAKAEYMQEVFLTRYKSDLLQKFKDAGEGTLPVRNLWDAEASLKEAEFRRYSAQQRLINLGLEPPEIDTAGAATPQAYARRLQFLGLPDEVVAELKPRPNTANMIPLVAPFDGIVTQLDAVAGEAISPDKPQFVIADVSTMWITLSVRKEDAGKLSYGQTISFTATGLPSPVTGRLAWVSTEVDVKTRTVQARCDVPNPLLETLTSTNGGLRLLRANLFGTATVLVARHKSTVVVPDSAIQWMPDRTPLVFVGHSDGIAFEPRKVLLGLSRNGQTEILEGIVSGERVVIDGSYVLKSELMKDMLAGG